MFAALSDRVPKVQQIVRRFFALGPIVYLYRMTSPLGKLAIDSQFLEISQLVGINQWLPYSNFIYTLAYYGCQVFSGICQYLISEIADQDGGQYDNTKLLYQILSYEPAGSSVKQLIHYQQNYKGGNPAQPSFAKFNFGEIKNLEKYGQMSPPQYDVSQIDKELFLYQGYQDLFSAVADVDLLLSKLSTSATIRRYSEMGHVTYMWSLFIFI
jgi:lysosomal acid lipase/cholesteryl ester hydrolase